MVLKSLWRLTRLQESAIETNPLDRGHQDKITSFKQEISVIVETLQEQQKILDFAQPNPGGMARSSDIFRSSTEPRPYLTNEPSYLVPAVDSRSRTRSRSRTIPRAGTPGRQLDATDPNGVLGLLMQDSQALIDRKIREFQEMNTRASELEAWVGLSALWVL